MPTPVGEEAVARFTPGAMARMRQEIHVTGGREVFFAGGIDAQGIVERVRVCARGTDAAVPAFFDMLQPREVVIHNHPTGAIEPSEPDLEVASICGNNGHGVYIVDNEVSRVYVVVEPFLDKQVHKLDPADLAAAFRPSSTMARVLPQFEVRPQQTEMMEIVARAFNHDGVAVIEAPTGVGKTLAYLLPAVEWSMQNRERIVISTRTINLQEQIALKDIPLLKRCLGKKFSAVLVKGRHNYLCRRKLARALSEATLFEEEDEETGLKALSAWAEKTEDGSRSDLPFMPRRELWESVCSEVDTCSGSRCPNAKACFVMRARREVAKADLIIANHHILFSDLNVKKDIGDFSSLAVLPAYRRVIFDEAHSIEDSATEYFGIEATRNGAYALLGRFQRRERIHEHGLLPFIKAKLIKEVRSMRPADKESLLDLIDNQLSPGVSMVREALNTAFTALRSLAAEKCGQIGRDIKWRLTEKELADPELREIHSVYVLSAVEEIRTFIVQCNQLIERLKRMKPAPDEVETPFLTEIMELQGYRARLDTMASALSEATSQEMQSNTVRWIEIDSADTRIVRVVRCPLDVGQCLADWVYGNLKTVVMTSATLTVQQEFDYLFSRIGLNRVEADRVETAVISSPFHFERQALLCIAGDMASPDEKRYHDETVDAVRRVLGITRGHALVLFTSFYAMDYVFRRLEADLQQAGITPLKQGAAPRTQLLDRFRKDVSSVLFATDSFWEGIDVAGEALQCVIVPKLPFRVPTEPIQQARAEAVDSAGGNSFMAYTVPQAVIKFRQGFGRLIRRRSDRGTIVLLDRRVINKYYGKAFLDSLPGVPIVKGASAQVYKALEEFYTDA